jgi:hypothetical protein
MSSDDTPPKNRLIATLAFVSLCTLVALKFILTSYFNEMVEADKATKISKPEELYAARAEGQKNLASSPVPIDQAMSDLEKGRPDLISPKQSDDTGPLIGWAKLPHALPPKPAPTPTMEPPPMAPADAGAAKDGGKPPRAPAPAADGGKAP